MRSFFYKLFALFLLIGYIFSIGIAPVAAQTITATFVLSPASKSVKVGQTFTVDVNITATSNKRISYGRAILAFDPTLLQMTQSVQHGSLFCNFPSDNSNYIADNSQGIIMVTGTATGTGDCPFPEITDNPDLFVRITFKAKKAGTADVQFLFNGQDAAGFSGIKDTNSPPQFIMTTPQDAQYKITSTAATPTTAPPDDLGVDPRILIAIAFGFVIVGLAFHMRKTPQRVLTVTEAS